VDLGGLPGHRVAPWKGNQASRNPASLKRGFAFGDGALDWAAEQLALQAQVFAVVPAIEILRFEPYLVCAYPIVNDCATAVADERYFDQSVTLGPRSSNPNLPVKKEPRKRAGPTGPRGLQLVDGQPIGVQNAAC
jgi:hypothetical protein